MLSDETDHTPVGSVPGGRSAPDHTTSLVGLPGRFEPGRLPMLWRVDDRLTTRAVNGAFADLLGADRADLVGQPWFALMRADCRDSLRHLISGPRYQSIAGLQLRRADGAAVAVAVRCLYGGPSRRSAVFIVEEVADDE